ncbi:cobinamide kinase / cobinamide phosphate guanyltransferase domain protein [Mycobacterium xenopi 3993]|nr:cobinamide kinase / cobinamide phosphate guanyltransferase domain protein [Mycobacterium xenopi 3993]
MSGDWRKCVAMSSVSTVDQCAGRRLRCSATRRDQSSSPSPARR